MGLKSRASARANFVPGTTQEEAWRVFANMFGKSKSPLIGMAGHACSEVKSQSGGAGLDVGDEFVTHHGSNHIEIVHCSSPHYLTYVITSGDGGVLERREIQVSGSPTKPVLHFSLTIDFRRFSFGLILEYIFSLGRPAARELRTLLSTEGREMTSYFGQWTSLPLDYASVTVY